MTKGVHPPIVFVMSPPRSGSSLIAKYFIENGFFAGNTKVGDQWNYTGYFENIEVSRLLSMYLKRNDKSNLCKRYNPVNLDDPYLEFHNEFLSIMGIEGYTGGSIVFKDPKICLCWRMLWEAFPQSIWVILHRNVEDVFRSFFYTPFMDSYMTRQGWEYYLDCFIANMNSAKCTVDYYEVDSTKVLQGDRSKLFQIIQEIKERFLDAKDV